jgi:hypothetical protein
MPAATYIFRQLTGQGNIRANPLFLFGTTYMFLHILVFGVILDFYAIWYAYLFWAILIMFVTISMMQLRVGSAVFPRIYWAFLICFAIFVHLVFMTRVPHLARGPEKFDGLLLSRLAQQYPNGVTAGALNAGALGYIAPKYGKIRIVNLDGLVNNQAFRARREGVYLEYLISTVDVLLESPEYVSRFVKPDEIPRLMESFISSEDGYFWKKVTPSISP